MVLNGAVLPYVDVFKLLGLYLDAKLTWKYHIQELKGRCVKALGLLRSLTGTSWEADQRVRMHLYKALIRSRLDYASIVYCSAREMPLNEVNVVANDVMRIATGAFRSSPVQSLEVLCNERPLEYKRMLQTQKYYYKMRSQWNNPALRAAVITRDERLITNKGITPTFAIRAPRLMNRLVISRGIIKPSFSYRLLSIEKPTWSLRAPAIDIELSEGNKHDTPAYVYKQLFRHLMEEKYRAYQEIYTDGSKTETGVAAAVVWGTQVSTETLPSESTVYTAGVHAIHMAVKHVQRSEARKCVISTDFFLVH